MDESPSRRRMLALLGSTSLGGSAGCLDTIRGGTSDDSEPTIPDVDCTPDEFSSLSTDVPADAWSPTRGNQRRTGANHTMEPLDIADTEQLQATELFSASSVGLPAVVDGTVYVSNEKTYALNVETGETKWSRYTQALETPTVTEDTVYLSASGPRLLALACESGEYRWTVRLKQDPPREEGNQTIGTVPLVTQDTVVVGHEWFYGDHQRSWLSALDLRCGSERWSVKLEPEYHAGLATDGETVYAATRHHVYALDAGDGTEHWRVNISDGQVDADAPPVLAGETVLVNAGPTIHALSTADGSERWNTRGGEPTVDNSTVFVAEGDPSRITALDLVTGEQLWEFTLENPFGIPSAITAVPETLYCLGEFGHTDFRILVLNATTGTKQTEAALPRSIDSDPITVSELAVTDDGIFTRSDYTEGQDEDKIHRFTPG